MNIKKSFKKSLVNKKCRYQSNPQQQKDFEYLENFSNCEQSNNLILKTSQKSNRQNLNAQQSQYVNEFQNDLQTIESIYQNLDREQYLGNQILENEKIEDLIFQN
ncbi:hypothetical protein ABPG74_007511 [Tetrahymena malaccensis]